MSGSGISGHAVGGSGIGQKHLVATSIGREFLLGDDEAAARAAIGALGDIVEDTTPQLGGDLDTNGKNINHTLLTASYPVFTDASKNLVSKKVEYADIKTKALVALSDADNTLTATQMIDSGILTITPTTARTLTTATAASIIAGITNQQTGTWFDFTLVCLAAFNVTIGAGTGVTLTGKMVANDNSITLKALITSGTTVTIFRT